MTQTAILTQCKYVVEFEDDETREISGTLGRADTQEECEGLIEDEVWKYARSATEKAKFQPGTMAESFAILAVVIKDKLRRFVIICETRTSLAGIIIVLLFALGSARAENVRHDKLAALLSDPGSDLSALKGDGNLEAAARLDVRLYAQAHKRKAYGNDCLGIGLEHAVKHHLKGRSVDVYALAFDAACSAFFEKHGNK